MHLEITYTELLCSSLGRFFCFVFLKKGNPSTPRACSLPQEHSSRLGWQRLLHFSPIVRRINLGINHKTFQKDLGCCLLVLILIFFFFFFYYYLCFRGFLGSSNRKESVCNAGDRGSIPGSGRSPGERHSNPLQYSCLENSVDREAWWATVHGLTKSRTPLSD